MGGGVHYKLEVGISMHHGHSVTLRREELQTAPNAEAADKDPGPFLKPWDTWPAETAKSAPAVYMAGQKRSSEKTVNREGRAFKRA